MKVPNWRELVLSKEFLRNRIQATTASSCGSRAAATEPCSTGNASARLQRLASSLRRRLCPPGDGRARPAPAPLFPRPVAAILPAGARGQTWLLPGGQSAEQEGEAAVRLLLLVWAAARRPTPGRSPGPLSLAGLSQASYPGRHLFLVRGVAPGHPARSVSAGLAASLTLPGSWAVPLPAHRAAHASKWSNC